jgi:hypothetical protein
MRHDDDRHFIKEITIVIQFNLKTKIELKIILTSTFGEILD